MIELVNDVSLRVITMDDYDRLFDLMSRIYPNAYTYLWPDHGQWYLNYIYGKEKVQKDLTEKNSSFYFVIVDEQEEGILKLIHDKPLPEKSDLNATYLHRIYISENIQGQGVAGALMRFTEAEARKKDSEIIWLECMDSKHQALNYYKKHGFVLGNKFELTFEKLIEEYRGIYYMWKRLS